MQICKVLALGTGLLMKYIGFTKKKWHRVLFLRYPSFDKDTKRWKALNPLT